MRFNDTKTFIITALALAAMSSGCGSETVDIGDDHDPALLGASLSDYRGTWVGHAELAEWDDGTTDVRLELDEQGNGVLEVGLGEELEPPVADDAYPRDFDYMATYATIVGPITGFSYPIAGAVVESKRIRLSSNSGELYREYCDLQTPMFAGGSTGYNCTGFESYSGGGPACESPLGTTDCDALMCMHVCVCDEEHCHAARFDEPNDIRLDAQLESEGEELVGSFEIPPQTFDERRSFQIVMTRE